MFNYILRRLLIALPSLLGISLVLFTVLVFTLFTVWLMVLVETSVLKLLLVAVLVDVFWLMFVAVPDCTL